MTESHDISAELMGDMMGWEIPPEEILTLPFDEADSRLPHCEWRLLLIYAVFNAV